MITAGFIGRAEAAVTKGYHWAKIILACVTVLVAEMAFLGLSTGDVDWRAVAVSLALAWGVIQFVEFFLLKDAIENSIAKGVVDWVRENIKVTEVDEPAPAPAPAPASAPATASSSAPATASSSAPTPTSSSAPTPAPTKSVAPKSSSAIEGRRRTDDGGQTAEDGRQKVDERT
jgi:hypothetical protein